MDHIFLEAAHDGHRACRALPSARRPRRRRSIRACRLRRRATRARWDAFVARLPEATFFHRVGWQRDHRATSSAIDTHLPLRRARRRDRRRAAAGRGQEPAVRPLAGVAAVRRLRRRRGDDDDAARRADRRGAGDSRAQLGVGHLELRNRAARSADWPRRTCTSPSARRSLPDDEANMLAIPRKQRAMVRKGIKHGLAQRDRRRRRPLLRALRRQRAPPRHAGVRRSATSRALQRRCSATTARC